LAGRNSPKHYPNLSKSLVFQQTKNGFVNKTSEWLTDFKWGLLTDAVYDDLDQDGQPELLIAGEWMSPRVFQFSNGFQDVTKDFGFQNMKGLWESILITDVNQDGKTDILLGNRGLNNIYKASPEQPLKMVAGDFDQNSTTDYLMFQADEIGNYKPLLGYKRIASQLPKIRKDFNSYEAFATASWDQFMNNSGSKTLEVNELKHVLLLNKGNHNFTKIALPHFTQNSIGRSFASMDFDGKTYFFLAGNHYDTDAEFTVYDASNGHVMTWDEKQQNFNLIPIEKSGFVADGDVRGLLTLKIKGKSAILVLNNDGMPEMFVLDQ
jgi:hypothetical protein